MKITQESSHHFTDGDGRRTFGCYNHNAFLDMMDGALTGKTGFTGLAGYCYVGAVEQEEELYIVALLACGWPNNKAYKWSDMRKLVNYGLEHYEYRDVWQEPPQLEIPVSEGVSEDGSPDGTAYVKLEAGIQPIAGLSLLLREDEGVRIQVDTTESLEAPVKEGTIAGSVSYYLDDMIVKSYNLVTAKAVARRDFWWYLQYLKNMFLFAGEDAA